MISLKRLFTPLASLDADQVRKYIASHPEGTYTLIDVRQPTEYKKEHIPGAKLLPLPQLVDSLSELDPQKPTIVY